MSDFENSLRQSSRSPTNGPMESINLLMCSIAFPFLPSYRAKVGVSYFFGYGGLRMYCIGSFRCLPLSLSSREVRLDRVTNYCARVFCSPDWGFPTAEPLSCCVRGFGSRVVIRHLDLVPPLGFSQIQLAQTELAAFLVTFQEQK